MSDSKNLPHSKTVRGTLGNPKTQQAIANEEKPRSMLGDPGSLKAESLDSDPVKGRQNQDGGTVDLGSAAALGYEKPDESGNGNPSAAAEKGGYVEGEGKEIEGIEWSQQEVGGKAARRAKAGDADSGDFDASKEENKNFDPRKYRKEVVARTSGSGFAKGKDIEGVEWSEQQVDGKGQGGGRSGDVQKEHSKTVRGTMDNPRTKEMMQHGKRPPAVGDLTSLEPERDEGPTLKSKL